MTLFAPDIVYHGDDVGFGVWTTGHFYEHKAFLNVAAASGFNVADYDLFGWDPRDRGVQRAWLEAHGTVHESLRQFTGITGIDFADVDFRVKRQFDDWMWYHSQEHQQLRNAFNLT